MLIKLAKYDTIISNSNKNTKKVEFNYKRY